MADFVRFTQGGRRRYLNVDLWVDVKQVRDDRYEVTLINGVTFELEIPDGTSVVDVLGGVRSFGESNA